jgi:hypothetical protein
MKLCPLCGKAHKPWDCPGLSARGMDKIQTETNLCPVCGSETCEGTHELDASKHQWVLTSEYCNLKIDKAAAEIVILKAFAEFGTTDHQMSGEFRPWLSIEAQKRVYWILRNFIDEAEKKNENRR